MSARTTQLIDGATGNQVEAQLHDGLKVQDLLLVERVWSAHRARLMASLLQAGVTRQEWPQSLHWDWARKAPELKLLVNSACGLVCQGDWQALMITKTQPYQARLAGDRGKPLVYVDFLEVAPWNWPIPQLQQRARFKACGSVLLRQAVAQSRREGFHGRLGLHALPQAESYYERCGMTRVAVDAAKEDLVYFEFGRSEAQQFLDGRMP